MFSLSYLLKASAIFLRYPSAIPRLFWGSNNASDHINMLRQQRWIKSKIARRYLYGFYIELNKNDDTGVAPSISIDGWYEPEQTELLRKILKKKMVVVDIGANIGWYTLFRRKLWEVEEWFCLTNPSQTTFLC